MNLFVRSPQSNPKSSSIVLAESLNRTNAIGGK